MSLIRNRVAPRPWGWNETGGSEAPIGAPSGATVDPRMAGASPVHSPIVAAPRCSSGTSGYFPLRLRQTAALPRPKARDPGSYTSSCCPHTLYSRWARRLPLIGVVLSISLALLALAWTWYAIVSWFLQQISQARTAEVMQAVMTPPGLDPWIPPVPTATLVTATDAQALAGLGSSRSLDMDEAESAFGTPGAPTRRLQNIVSIGPPEGAGGFDTQNMWEAFKGAPQDYLLFLWFLLNLCLAGCFCSWMCTQRNYQKAVMVSP